LCIHRYRYIDKYTLFTKITPALLFWTCPVEEFRNINFPEIQFTFMMEGPGQKKRKGGEEAAECFG